ncbi:hypothetical protein BB560_003517 [Smittium megazygosporum]|uniref:Cytochrome P450 n=1 Tax=Smittium megazygosporum TaxID=133381 RepID=A0A2T9ZBW2_9FUNG|nr:hypothetical protein BB560_003517 [Smittium megazygosporum]
MLFGSFELPFYISFVITTPLCMLLVIISKFTLKWLVFNKFTKAEYVSKFIGSKSDLNLGKPHLLWFSSLPEKALSKHKFEKKTFFKKWSNNECFESISLHSIIRSFVYSNTSNFLRDVEYTIHVNLNNENGLFLKNDYVLFENIFEYFHDILIDIAIRQYYGGAAKSDPGFCNAIEQLLEQPLSFGEKYINHLLMFRKKTYDRGREYLRDFVLRGKFKELNKSSFDENECIASLLLQNREKLDIPNDIFYTSLPNHFYLSVITIGNQLSNFFIDISLNPRVFKKLEIEQREIMAKYGNAITIKHLDKMVYLDAAITETLRFSTNHTTMKQSLCDIYLPNGVLIPKESFVKLKAITYNRSSDIFLDLPHDYIPERHFILGTKLSEPSKTNLAWGLGRPCPYRKYASIFMKLFIATVIRKYEVSQGNRNSEFEHSGYIFDNFVEHAKKSLYLRKRNI